MEVGPEGDGSGAVQDHPSIREAIKNADVSTDGDSDQIPK